MMVWLLACGAPRVDPLAAYREALAAAETAPLPSDWPAEGQLLLSLAPLDAILTDLLEGEIAARSKPVTIEMLGLRATVLGEPKLMDVSLQASDDCPSCLAAAVSLAGTDTLVLSNPTGSMQHSQAYAATASATVALELGEDKYGHKAVFAKVAAPETWDLAVDVEGVPAVWGAAVSAGVRQGLQKLVASMQVPPIPVAHLPDDGPVPLRGLRVRPLPNAIGVDMAFGVPGTAQVADPPSDAPVVVALSEETLLGLVRYAAISAAEKGEGESAIEVRSLDLSEGGRFQLGLRLWDLRPRKPKSIDVVVGGTIALSDGELSLSAEDAAFEGPVNPVVWLARNKILERVRDSLRATVPAELGRDTPSGHFGVVLTSVTTVDHTLTIRADLDR